MEKAAIPVTRDSRELVQRREEILLEYFIKTAISQTTDKEIQLPDKSKKQN